MRKIQLGNITVGEGRPKICVVLFGAEFDLVLDMYEKCKDQPADLFEWRTDFLVGKQYEDVDGINDTLQTIRAREEEERGDSARPVILTLRTEDEGGNAPLVPREYREVIHSYIMQSEAEILDIEAFNRDEGVQRDVMEFLVDMAHENGKKVILSNHDLTGMPVRSEIVYRLKIMASLGADLPKVAYTAQEEADVKTLLTAAAEMQDQRAELFIALAMGEPGQPSRICGGEFGSCITFASSEAGETAPGQIPATDLQYYLDRYYAG